MLIKYYPTLELFFHSLISFYRIPDNSIGIFDTLLNKLHELLNMVFMNNINYNLVLARDFDIDFCGNNDKI